MRIYIAGPMTGIADMNFPSFKAKAAELRAKGYDVVSPHELKSDDPSFTWESHLRQGIEALITCEAVCLLDGWENSKGARLEANIGRALGMRVCREGWDGPS